VAEQSETVEPLILDMLEWIGPASRPYDEVLEAWRTSCPRLPVWEEAVDRGLVVRRRAPDGGLSISLSNAGAAHLRRWR
jgi:D-3-phosphoglycerate dehydrogenase / 2-oxoglutarate reductase